jgi:hypothetical protein
MKNAFFWDVTPYASCKNRRLGGRYRLHHQDGKNQRASNASNNIIVGSVNANVVCSLLNLSTLTMEAMFLRNVGS